MLAQRPSSIAMSANTCKFPPVRTARATNTKKSARKAASTMSRKVGCSEEPGSRISEKKDIVVRAHKWVLTNISYSTDNQPHPPLTTHEFEDLHRCDAVPADDLYRM